MDFFQPITTNPNATYETLDKQRVAWNKGFDHLDSETRQRVVQAFTNSSPVKKGYVFTNSKKYNGKSVLEWAREYGVHHATAIWHLEKYGNMDRCLQDYHTKRAVIFWGKNVKEWVEYIDEPGLSTGSVRQAIRKGRESFQKYLYKKTGRVIKLKGE